MLLINCSKVNVLEVFFVTGVLRQPLVATGFGHALNIETLVAAAERRDTPIEVSLSQ
jgi:CCR4-NOT transcription complex subunit 1